VLHRELDWRGPDRVVLVHGFTQTLRSWDPVAQALAQRVEVVRVDLPGHGGSAKGAGDYSLGGMANVLRDLMGALELERATLLPPLARLVAPRSRLAARALARLPWLRGHYLGLLRRQL
jgi:alpha-beta hydrolase superfamily lysophospholipase